MCDDRGPGASKAAAPPAKQRVKKGKKERVAGAADDGTDTASWASVPLTGGSLAGEVESIILGEGDDGEALSLTSGARATAGPAECEAAFVATASVVTVATSIMYVCNVIKVYSLSLNKGDNDKVSLVTTSKHLT